MSPDGQGQSPIRSDRAASRVLLVAALTLAAVVVVYQFTTASNETSLQVAVREQIRLNAEIRAHLDAGNKEGLRLIVRGLEDGLGLSKAQAFVKDYVSGCPQGLEAMSQAQLAEWLRGRIERMEFDATSQRFRIPALE